ERAVAHAPKPVIPAKAGIHCDASSINTWQACSSARPNPSFPRKRESIVMLRPSTPGKRAVAHALNRSFPRKRESIVMLRPSTPGKRAAAHAPKPVIPAKAGIHCDVAHEKWV